MRAPPSVLLYDWWDHSVGVRGIGAWRGYVGGWKADDCGLAWCSAAASRLSRRQAGAVVLTLTKPERWHGDRHVRERQTASLRMGGSSGRRQAGGIVAHRAARRPYGAWYAVEHGSRQRGRRRHLCGAQLTRRGRRQAGVKARRRRHKWQSAIHMPRVA